MTSILNKLIRFFFTNSEVDLLYTSFVGISQRILWQSLCFRWIVRYHSRFSRADLDDLCDRSQSFLVRQLLAVNLLTVRTVDASLNRALSLNTWSCDLTNISNKLIGFFLTNAKVDFFNARFVSISQRILWQSLCFRWIVRYHSRFSRADLDDLCDRSQSFLVRQLLAVNLLTIGTVDTSLDGPLTLYSRSRDLTTSFWNLICILLVNRKINFFYSNLIICS